MIAKRSQGPVVDLRSLKTFAYVPRVNQKKLISIDRLLLLLLKSITLLLELKDATGATKAFMIVRRESLH
jgi:hypothetical protein